MSDGVVVKRLRFTSLEKVLLNIIMYYIILYFSTLHTFRIVEPFRTLLKPNQNYVNLNNTNVQNCSPAVR